MDSVIRILISRLTNNSLAAFRCFNERTEQGHRFFQSWSHPDHFWPDSGGHRVSARAGGENPLDRQAAGRFLFSRETDIRFLSLDNQPADQHYSDPGLLVDQPEIKQRTVSPVRLF